MNETLQKQLAYLVISSTRHVGYLLFSFCFFLLLTLGSPIGAWLFLVTAWLLIQNFTLKQRKLNAMIMLLGDCGDQALILTNMGVKFSEVKEELKHIKEEGQNPLDSEVLKTIVQKLKEQAILRELERPNNSPKLPFTF